MEMAHDAQDTKGRVTVVLSLAIPTDIKNTVIMCTLQNKSNSQELIAKCVKQLVWNYFVIIFPLYSLSFSVLYELGFEESPETIPSWWIILLQQVFFLFVEDFCHYWLHRLMHTKWLYV